MPFGTFGAQTRLSGHHSVPAQSESTVQAVPHAPLDISQSGPAGLPAQSAFVVQRPQTPIIGPESAQRGFSSRQAAPPMPTAPKSRVQGPQVLFVTSQNAVGLLHCSFEVHCTQLLGDVAIGPEQTRMSAQAPVMPAGTPVISQVFATQASVVQAFVSAQSVAVRQPTQVGPAAAMRSQIGVPIPQPLSMPVPGAESSHAVQALRPPVETQAGAPLPQPRSWPPMVVS